MDLRLPCPPGNTCGKIVPRAPTGGAPQVLSACPTGQDKTYTPIANTSRVRVIAPCAYHIHGDPTRMQHTNAANPPEVRIAHLEAPDRAGKDRHSHSHSPLRV